MPKRRLNCAYLFISSLEIFLSKLFESTDKPRLSPVLVLDAFLWLPWPFSNSPLVCSTPGVMISSPEIFRWSSSWKDPPEDNLSLWARAISSPSSIVNIFLNEADLATRPLQQWPILLDVRTPHPMSIPKPPVYANMVGFLKKRAERRNDNGRPLVNV